MPLFQGFGKRVSEVAKSVSQKTAEAAEVARLNSRIAAREAEVEQLFLQIGKAYYSMRGAGGANEAADMFCQKVTELEQECESMRKEIDALRRQSRCPNCGGVQPIEASFCASCGTKLPKPAVRSPRPPRTGAPARTRERARAGTRAAPPDERRRRRDHLARARPGTRRGTPRRGPGRTRGGRGGGAEGIAPWIRAPGAREGRRAFVRQNLHPPRLLRLLSHALSSIINPV